MSNEDLAPVLRGPGGKLLPGARLNPHGRPHGRANNTTLLARREFEKHAHKAAQRIVKQMDDANPFVAFAACRVILERVMPKLADVHGDHEWAEYATTDEIKTVMAIIEACRERMPVNDARAPIDVTPESDDEPQRDTFTLASLPSPTAAEPARVDPPPASDANGDDDDDSDDEGDDDDEEYFP